MTKTHLYKNVFIVGYGDIGRRLAHLLDVENSTVYGLARSAASIERMEQDNVIPVPANLDDIQSLLNLSLARTLLFYLAPPPVSGITDTRVSNLLNSMNHNELPLKIVYISTSGVYGDQKGHRVTEKTPPCPGADRSRRRLNAEQQLARFCKKHEVELVILRVSGIYGPGRLPVRRIQDRVPVLHEELAPTTNRIHEDDLAIICLAAAANGANGEIYNVSDGCSSNMTRYFYQVADHLKLPRPPSIGWQEAEILLSEGMLSYLRESRSMDNTKMIEELKISLKHPGLRQGLSNMGDITG